MTHSLPSLIQLLPEHARRTRQLQRDEFLFRQGEPARAIFMLSSGRMRLIRDLADGSGITLHVARAGESFAEAALFASAYHCHAVAEVASCVISVDADTLTTQLQSNAALGLALSQLLAEQVRELRAMLSLRDIRSADERLLTWLRRKADQEQMSVLLDRPWAAIAEELGLTREAVYRSLSKLQSQGLLKRDGRQGRGQPERISLLTGC